MIGLQRRRRPLFTVVMAAFDAEPYVGAALTSIASQSVDDLEVVVVDDASRDETAAEVERAARRDARVRLVQLPRNRGQAAALNAAMGEARGRYLAVLDADDEATPTRLADQLTLLEADPGLVLVGGSVQPFQGEQQAVGAPWRYPCDDAEIRVGSLFRSEFISGAMTFDREALLRHGLRFDERRRLGADWALSIAAMRVGRVASVDGLVMRYRLHPGQLTAGMMDDLTYDSAHIRRELLTWIGAEPSDEELTVHMAVSPCNYWPYGAHPFFRARRATLAAEAAVWFDRLREASFLTRRVSPRVLDGYLEKLEADVAGHLRGLDVDEEPVRR